jgi:hypothetical protein
MGSDLAGAYSAKLTSSHSKTAAERAVTANVRAHINDASHGPADRVPGRIRAAHPARSAGQSTRKPAPSATPAASPAAASPSSGSSGRSAPDCTGSAGMLPDNYATIVTFLMAHGYTGLAASGIAGNIYQESKGNPESIGSGGGGLIGWTPLPAGFVTGNPVTDLQTQLEALLTYNEQWSQYIPALNAAPNAVDAAYIYMSDFERPGIPAAANREDAAAAVAAACHL